MPAGLPLPAEDINLELRRRQKGYGSGGRMQIEKDKIVITSGLDEWLDHRRAYRLACAKPRF